MERRGEIWGPLGLGDLLTRVGSLMEEKKDSHSSMCSKFSCFRLLLWVWVGHIDFSSVPRPAYILHCGHLSPASLDSIPTSIVNLLKSINISSRLLKMAPAAPSHLPQCLLPPDPTKKVWGNVVFRKHKFIEWRLRACLRTEYWDCGLAHTPLPRTLVANHISFRKVITDSSLVNLTFQAEDLQRHWHLEIAHPSHAEW